jgi:Dihydrofolate reductase
MTMEGQKTISLIAAAAENLAIGRRGDMPWHISADLKYFKQVTTGCSVIMGRRTWESIGCRPLPNRQNIVVSRSLTSEKMGIEVFGTLGEAIENAASEEIFIIGGGSVYSQALPLAERIYLTEIHTTVEDADTFFPDFREMKDDEGSPVWKESWRSEVLHDERSGLDFEFVRYERVII